MSRHADDIETLLGILEDIARIEEYVAGLNKEDFLRDTKTCDAVSKRLEEIGESVKDLSEEAKSRAPHIPWHSIVGMRNVLSHTYDDVDFEIVWDTIIHDLPQLKETVMELLRQLGHDPLQR